MEVLCSMLVSIQKELKSGLFITRKIIDNEVRNKFSCVILVSAVSF